ncbi:MAG: metallophosphoesterase family protein [Candidatus Margulisbacteria bacterium]|nr:metallophosphoesterase family protein [Candidatus Margulisiibacteriota bacterium]
MKTIYAIGDIHGQLEMLTALIKKINLKPDDLLIFLGDYIDRGPDPRGVIDYLLGLAETQECIFLKGNHEDMMLRALAGDASYYQMWMLNGGEKTINSYGRETEIIRLHGKFFQTLLPYYSTDKYFFVHAGINPNKPLNKQTEHDLLWIREEFINNPTHIDKKVIFGHTHYNEPLVLKDKIGIDTSAAWGGPLTAIMLPAERFICVKNNLPH